MRALLALAVVTASSAAASLAGPLGGDSKPAEPTPREALERALPRLAERSAAWLAQYKCASCHQVPFALWALNAGRAAGFEVDARTTEWNRSSIEKALAAKSTGDEVWELLLSGSTVDTEDPARARAELVALLRANRQADGGWLAGGQLPDQRRPLAETHATSSAWSRLALARNGAPVAEAMAFEASTSVEHLALAALASDDKAPLTALLAAQNDDGGWPWLLGEPSDPLGTGQALHALSEIRAELAAERAPRTRAAIERGRAYLCRTQREDGGWTTPSTLAKHPRAESVIADDWGTAWAAIGLLLTQAPDESRGSAPFAAGE